MKLFTLLKALSKRDLTKFQHFLASPLFNKRRDVQLLLQSWKAGGARSHPSSFFWAQVFPGKAFSPKDWRLLCSRLFKLLEEFISLDEMRQDDAHKRFYLAKAYRKMQHEKLFKEAIRDARLAWEKQPYRDTAYLQAKHDLSFEEYDYIISVDRKEKTNLQSVNDHLDAYILAIKLRQACYALSRKIIKQEQYDIGLLTEVLQYVDRHPAYLDVPAIAVYYYCYKSISVEESEGYFTLLRKAISDNKRSFPASEIRDIYTLAINYAIRKLNSGEERFAKEALELYLLSLQQGYLLEDGIMLESTYSNIVSLASKLDRHDWAGQFVEDYQHHLKPAFREPLFHFSMGKLNYDQGHYQESLNHLVRVESKAPFLLLGARVLQLKIYYELGEFDLLESLLESLRVYLQRSKDLAYRKTHYTNILTFTRQLLQLTIMSKEERALFRQRVNAATVFAEKEWFLKQIG